MGSALAAVVVLGACDSTAEPTTSATPTASATSTPTTASASPSPSPSPTPTETSTIPAAAQQNTPEGAEAFLDYYFSAANKAWTLPDPLAIKGLGTRNCEFCARTIETAEYLQEHGERYAKDPVTVVSLEAFGGAPRGEQYVAVTFRQNAVDVLDAGGDVARSDPSATIDGNAAVRWSSGRWLLRGIEVA